MAVAGFWLGAAALPVFAHLPGLTLTGMEHILHAAVTLAFAVLLFRRLGDTAPARLAPLYALAFLLPFIRLEGLFAVALAALLLLAHRKILPALVILIMGLTPTMIIGLYYHSMGAFFLPNSIVAKAVPGMSSLPGLLVYYVFHYWDGLIRNPTLTGVMMAAAVWLAYGVTTRGRKDIEQALFLLGLCAAHLTFASVGWFARYEAYLIILGIFLLAWRFWQAWESGEIKRSQFVTAASAGLFCCVLVFFGISQAVTLWRTRRLPAIISMSSSIRWAHSWPSITPTCPWPPTMSA